jgi:putative phage-type endonuclease
LVTPTARLVLPATVVTDEWLAARQHGIGASDVASILDLDGAFGTPRSVFLDKLGKLQDGAGEAAYWGTVYEAPIAQRWESRNRSVVEDIGLVANADDPIMMATLDRRIVECPLPETRRQECALEVKQRSAFKSAQWNDGPPDDVLAQVLWQIAVTGYEHIHYAVLVGGNDYRQGVVRRADHEKTLQNLVTGCRSWWDRHIVPGILPPPSDHAAREVEMWKRLHPEPEGVIELDDDYDVLDLLSDYETARLAESAAGKLKEKAQAELLRLLDGHQHAFLNNDLAYSSKPTAGRQTCDFERLAERWPEAYRECISRTPGTRFSIGKDYRKTKGD